MPFGKKRNENDIIFRGYKTLKLLVKELRKNETDIRSWGCNLKKKLQGWCLKIFPWPILICLKMAEQKFKSHFYKDTFNITTD